MKVIPKPRLIIQLDECRGGDIVQLVDQSYGVYYLVVMSIDTDPSNYMKLVSVKDGFCSQHPTDTGVVQFKAVLSIEV